MVRNCGHQPRRRRRSGQRSHGGRPAPTLGTRALPPRPRSRNLREVVGQDAPADPPAHPPLAVVAAPLQAAIPPQRVNPTLDPRPEPIGTPEPSPPPLRPPPRRRLADVRQRHVLDPRLL